MKNCFAFESNGFLYKIFFFSFLSNLYPVVGSTIFFNGRTVQIWTAWPNANLRVSFYHFRRNLLSPSWSSHLFITRVWIVVYYHVICLSRQHLVSANFKIFQHFYKWPNHCRETKKIKKLVISIRTAPNVTHKRPWSHDYYCTKTYSL